MRPQSWPIMKKMPSSSEQLWPELKRAREVEPRTEAGEEDTAATRAGGPTEPQGTLEVPTEASLSPSLLPQEWPR